MFRGCIWNQTGKLREKSDLVSVNSEKLEKAVGTERMINPGSYYHQRQLLSWALSRVAATILIDSDPARHYHERLTLLREAPSIMTGSYL